MREKLAMWVASKIAPKGVSHLVQQLVHRGEISIAVDIGCGSSSAISKLRPSLRTIGVDASAAVAEAAIAADLHDEVVRADVSTEAGRQRLREIGPVDLVTIVHAIEHFPREQGLALLRLCEELTSKYVIIETPNGFLPQGPEYGNPFQRHLSGWFPHDFASHGYEVRGTFGTKFTYGYAGTARWDVPGMETFDLILSKLVAVERRPERAFSIIAIKDVRGVAARLAAR